jgi:hypothetical protein
MLFAAAHESAFGTTRDISKPFQYPCSNRYDAAMIPICGIGNRLNADKLH